MDRHVVAVEFTSTALTAPLRAQLERATSYLDGRLRSNGTDHLLTVAVVAKTAEDALVYARRVVVRFAQDAALVDLRFTT